MLVTLYHTLKTEPKMLGSSGANTVIAQACFLAKPEMVLPLKMERFSVNYALAVPNSMPNSNGSSNTDSPVPEARFAWSPIGRAVVG